MKSAKNKFLELVFKVVKCLLPNEYYFILHRKEWGEEWKLQLAQNFDAMLKDLLLKTIVLVFFAPVVLAIIDNCLPWRNIYTLLKQIIVKAYSCDGVGFAMIEAASFDEVRQFTITVIVVWAIVSMVLFAFVHLVEQKTY